jgi:hypothetical protein
MEEAGLGPRCTCDFGAPQEKVAECDLYIVNRATPDELRARVSIEEIAAKLGLEV